MSDFFSVWGKGAWSYEQAAEYLSAAGRFQTLEAARHAIQSSPTTFAEYLPPVWKVPSWATRAVSGGPGEALISTSGNALQVAEQASVQATQQLVKSGGVSITQASTGFSFSGMMAMDLGVLGAAGAPILGVALGGGLYESNPELWTKISQKLLPFCYPGTTQIPTWVDIIGETAIVKVAKDVIEALKELFDEEGIGGEASGTIDVTTPSGTVSVGYGTLVLTKNPGYENVQSRSVSGPMYRQVTSSSIRFLSKTPFTVTQVVGDATYTYQSIQTGNYYQYSYSWNTTYYSGPQLPINNSISDIAILDASPQIPSGEYPTGTSPWGGTVPQQIPQTNPIVDEDGSLIDMVPISPPYEMPDDWAPGLPVPSQDPEENPDPDIITLPDPQISPWLQPFPLPDITTEPDATADPSPYPLPEPSAPPIPQPEPDPPSQPDPSDPIPPDQTIIDPIPPTPPSEGIVDPALMPSIDVAFSQNTGVVSVYHPDEAELLAFERWLWVTYADATIDKIFNNPFDGVITLFELYCTPTDIGIKTIRSGFLDSGIDSAIISRYTEINCGTIAVPEYYGNYLDYTPYTKAHIYLPFIGIVDLNADDIIGHAVNVTYRIDEYNGACIAMITVAKSTMVNGEPVSYSNLMYQFSGNCAVELPLSGGSQASIKAGMMQADAYQTAAQITAAGSLLGGLASLIMGGIGGAVSQVGSAAGTLAYGQAQGLSNMLSGKSSVQKSGSFGGSYGAMGKKNPFIVITRPKQIRVNGYNNLYGYPAHKMVTIGACSGFIRCREVHVISSTATDDEKVLIEQLLKSGVYVT